MKKFIVLIAIVILGFGLYANLMADDQTVTNNENSGAGSLRQAILDVGSGQEITFDADYTITLSSKLSISKNLTITGTGSGNTIIQADEAPNTVNYNVFDISSVTVTIKDMTIRHGKANGGGINNGGALTLTNCTLSENYGYGGGINNDGTLTLTNCTVSGNSAGTSGGGIAHMSGTLTLTNCTISGDSAGASGGGIYNYATLYIKNTILANNTSDEESGQDFYNDIVWGTVNNNGYNIVEYPTGFDFSLGTGCILGEQASLNLRSTLEDNGTLNGTKTLALYSGSVAIDAGGDASTGTNNDVAVPSTDQRGAERYDFTAEPNIQSSTDIGAYEYWDDDGSLPVELSSFTAIAGDGEVTLRWTTESEIENLGFNIYCSLFGNRDYRQINGELIFGAGNSSTRHEYEYLDKGLTNGVTYWYKLEDVDYSGNTELHGPVSATPVAKAAPSEFRLSPNYPNPFNSVTAITYDLPEEGYVELMVYNIRGEKITTLMKGNQEAGSYNVNWDGTNRNGEMVSSGIYFLRIVSGSYSRTGKMIFVR